jgi:hypothetical protein
MGTAYTVADWSGFGGAVAAATAALTGLLFVAVSINMDRILEFAGLPARAGQTLLLFSTPLFTGLLLVVPGQPAAALGGEFLLLGLAVMAFHLVTDIRAPRSEQETRMSWLVSRRLPAVLNGGCVAVAGLTLLIQAGGGFYWLVPASLLAVFFGLINAWVLLVEIKR